MVDRNGPLGGHVPVENIEKLRYLDESGCRLDRGEGDSFIGACWNKFPTELGVVSSKLGEPLAGAARKKPTGSMKNGKPRRIGGLV
jgi:hypothetical protein